MLTRRKLLDLHIGRALYTMYECKGDAICAYQIFVDGKVARTFTDLFKCSRFLLEKWEESKK